MLPLPARHRRRCPTRSRSGARGFSLLELVIVLAILAVITAIAIQRVSFANDESRLGAAAAAFRDIEKAAQMYYVEFGELPADVGPGIMPPGFDSHVSASLFGSKPPMGTDWDWNPTWGSIQPNISMRCIPPPTAEWLAFDQRYDDGSLSTGKVRVSANGRQLHWGIDLPE
ncbi:MAG: prepilin-type N-terminal cleavage/methylation domain-containing protein [Planctomycetota bacterium]